MVGVRFLSTVNPVGFATIAKFYVGLTTDSFELVGDPIEVGAGFSVVPVQVETDLENDTIYFVKIVAESEGGITESSVTEFNTGGTTGGAPIVTDVVVEFL